MISWDGKVHNSAGFLFLLIITRSGPLGEIWWSVFISKSLKILCVSFSRTDSGLGICYSFVWSNLNFLHNSKWIPFPNHLCLIYTIFMLTCWICLLCDWSFCLYHHITYICCFVASAILAMIWFVPMALFCAAIRRDSISILRFLFLGHDHVSSCGISLVYRLKCQYSCFPSHFCFLGFWVFLYCWCLPCLYCFWSQWFVFLRAFLWSLRVMVSMHQCYLQFWRVIFLLLFLTYIVCNLWDVRLYTLSLVFLFSGPFVSVLLCFISRMVLNILRGGTA